MLSKAVVLLFAVTATLFVQSSVIQAQKKHLKNNLEIFDTRGKIIRTLLKERLNSGHHEVLFDAGDLSGGIYYCSIRTGAFKDLKKMILLK